MKQKINTLKSDKSQTKTKQKKRRKRAEEKAQETDPLLFVLRNPTEA